MSGILIEIDNEMEWIFVHVITKDSTKLTLMASPWRYGYLDVSGVMSDSERAERVLQHLNSGMREFAR